MGSITEISELNVRGIYSYADYLLWLFQDRVELIKGHIRKMSPSPSRAHQSIGGVLHREISYFLKNKSGNVFFAPFDVRLPRLKNQLRDEQIFDVVQPDICVVCNPSILDDKGCLGAPDIMIEIVSPSSIKHDVETKFLLYQEAEVQEYWIVFPTDKAIQQFILQEGKFVLKAILTHDAVLTTSILEGFELNVKEVFEK